MSGPFYLLILLIAPFITVEGQDKQFAAVAVNVTQDDLAENTSLSFVTGIRRAFKFDESKYIYNSSL